MKEVNLESLKGKTISSVVGLESESDEIVFTLSCGEKFKMHHYQDCCEQVYVNDICGDVDDLINAKIIHFEERVSDAEEREFGECGTWTFYDIQTTKGCVNIRWLGESNGYYSESVDVEWC